MRYPPNTPLGRFHVETLEERTDHCVASIPVAGLVNPLTGAVTSELAIEFTGNCRTRR
jgi:hypothetical protein